MMASVPVYGEETRKVKREVITERGVSSKRIIYVAVGKTRRIQLYSIRNNPEVKKIVEIIRQKSASGALTNEPFLIRIGEYVKTGQKVIKSIPTKKAPNP